MSFLHKQPTFFGLDISDLSIKIARVCVSGDSSELLSFGETRVPSGIITKGEVRDIKKLSDIIRKGIKSVKGEKLKTKYVVASLPEEKSFLDVLQVPVLSGAELDSVIRQEAENRIPFSLEEVYYDSEKLALQSTETKHQEILLAASPKKIVDPYSKALKIAGLQPLAMEIESLSIARSLMKENVFSSPVLIIDLGENRTSLIIFAGTSVRFTSTISVSSRRLTENIRDSLKIDFRKSERLKIKQGLYGEKKIFEAMMPSLTDLTEQIRNHLDYYDSHVSKTELSYSKKKLDKILLCGGGGNLKGLDEFLSSELKIDVVLGDPLINVQQKELQMEKGQILSFATAIGLALRMCHD